MSSSPEHQIANGKLTPESLTPVPQFNWVFLIELIVSGVLTLFFLFYFNRLFATLVSYGVRAYTWHYYRVYIDIHALQISLLAGRIFFKGIRYHGENETILVQTGYITWRFWSRPVPPGNTFHQERKARHPASEQDGDRHAGTENKKKQSPRIEVTLNGLEWFVYNRSPAYDSILAGFGLVPPANGGSDSSATRDGGTSLPDASNGDINDEAAASSPSEPLTPSSKKDVNSQRQKGLSSINGNVGGSSILQNVEQRSEPQILSLFPISMDCYRGALALGNENTKTILTLTFDKAVGKIDAGHSGPLDVYKQIFEYDLSHPIVQMKPNPDYKQSQLAAASSIEATNEESKNRGYMYSLHRRYRDHRRRVWNSVCDLIPYFQSSVESFHPRHDQRNRPASGAVHQDGWLGLTRYLDEEEQDEHEGWSSVEYGRFSTLLDSPSVYFRYYWDIGGPVAISKTGPEPPDKSTPYNINGAEPPEWGMDITIRGGLLNYGPWADRERINLQSVFIPNSYRDSQVTPILKPGEMRQSTAFVLNILIDETTTLRIPTRESSKDWQWKGRADQSRGMSRVKKKDKDRSRGNEADKAGTQGPDIRPFGWLSLRVDRGSTIVYSMAMFASNHGYCNKVDIDLRHTKMSSSVNHGILWQSDRQVISCDLSNPLQWNSLHNWSVDVESTKLELFLLWDHLILLTDLISDWTSGPFQEFYTFVPIKYHLSFAFLDFKLLINVNDLNIINNPSDLDDNSFLIIEGEILIARVEIPIVYHKANRNVAKFDIQGSNGDLRLSTPLWNTQRTFLDDRPVGGLDTLKIDGSYSWYSLTSPKVTDVAIINLSGSAPYLYLYGFILKNFLDVNENYFGRTIHFKTFDEHRAAVDSGAAQGHSGSNPAPVTNGLDVILHIAADDLKVLLPAGLYDRNENLALKAASLNLDVRFTNYYMDFHSSLSPVEISVLSENPGAPPVRTGPQLYINGLAIFGHRLFGLPPTEPTYACNWDFQVGSIVGECSPSFVKSAKSAFESLAFSFDDDENALPPLQTGIYDVTFLRANVKAIKVWVLAEETAFLFSTGTIDVEFNDRCGLKMSLFVNLTVPDVVVAIVDRKSARSRAISRKPVKTYACFQTALKLNTLGKREDFEHYRSLQQNHIRKHDSRTHRTPWLLFDELDIPTEDETFPHFIPPTMPVPSMPEPVRFPKTPRRSPYYQTPHQSPLKGLSDLITIPLSSSTNPTPDQYIPGGRLVRPTSTTWAMPQFHFYHIEPDKTNVPPMPSSSEFVIGQKQALEAGFGRSDAYDSLKGAQACIICTLEPGVTGFCSTEAVHALSSLLESIQPRNPIEILDSFQAKLTSAALRAQKSANKEVRSISTFSLELPLFRIRLLNPLLEPNDPTGSVRDQYYIDLLHARALIHEKAILDANISMKPKKSLTTHITVRSISISAQEENIDAATELSLCVCKISDVSFLFLEDKDIKSRLQIQNIRIMSSNESVAKFGLLLDRTNKVVGSISAAFQQIFEAHENRLLYLVHYLANAGANMPEPQFMTRLSYALRVTKPHLRLEDAWKIISRLRNIYKSITTEEQEKLRTDCQNDRLSYPADVKDVILSVFETWRSWELTPIKKSLIVKALWGEDDDVASRTADHPKEIDAAVFLRSTHVSLGPGPRENSFHLESMSTTIRFGAKTRDSSPSLKTKLLVVQNHCSNVSLQLNWELCEVLERVLSSDLNFAFMSSASQSEPMNQSGDAPKGEHEVHVIFVAEKGSARLDGINLRLALLGNALKASIIHRSNPALTEEIISVMLASKMSSAHVISYSNPLMEWKFHNPNIFLSRHSQERDQHIEHDWKCAATCEKLRYEVTENPLGLIHVADRVVEDEVKQVLKMIGSSVDTYSETGSSIQSKQEIHHFHVATFLDDYQICIALLPTVEYTIGGDVARLSVTPLGRMKFEVDYDIKNNLHTIQSSKDGNLRILSSMAIPPINGRVRLDMTHDPVFVDIDTTIEIVDVDASAIQNILGAINGPEISHFIEDLTHDGNMLKTHFNQVLSSGKTAQPVKMNIQKPGIVYQVRLTFAGIRTHATSPGLRTKDHSADMSLEFRTIQVHMENSAVKGIRNTQPEFHIYMSQIGISVKKKGIYETISHGKVALGARVSGSLKDLPDGQVMRLFHLTSSGLEVEMSAETASLVVDIVAHLQETIKTIDISQDIAHLRKIRKISFPRRRKKEVAHTATTTTSPTAGEEGNRDTLAFLDATYSVQLSNIQVSWLVLDNSSYHGAGMEDLVFSISKVELATKKTNAARLRIQHMQLQMVPVSDDKRKRSQNSALLPEAVFNVSLLSVNSKWKLALHAAGKALDLRTTSDFIIPASLLQNSLASAVEKVREAKSLWTTEFIENPNVTKESLGFKQLDSLLVDADFAGAIVTLQGRYSAGESAPTAPSNRNSTGSNDLRYGQAWSGDSVSTATLRAPGVALKVRYESSEADTPILEAEMKVDGSSNVLHPSVVPLLTQISSSIQDVVGRQEKRDERVGVAQANKSQDISMDPTTILGSCKLSIGLWIRKQEFTLSCQPIARVAATAGFEDVNITINTVQSEEQRRFFAVLVAFDKLQASVKHVYSNESTASFEVDSIVVSMMNSKHVSSSSGISAILKISPTRLQMNAKQAQDFLLFREIWTPQDDQPKRPAPTHEASPEIQAYMVQRYQQMAATGAFPWNSTLAIESLDIQLDLGQTIGKSDFTIKNLWISSKKTSDWEQNLCIGFETVGIKSRGRLSGFVELSKFKVRTSIEWPDGVISTGQTPLIQAAVGIGKLQAEASFEYLPFFAADVDSFEFFMYNVRDDNEKSNDRLVSVLEGDKLHVFCTTMTAAQGLGLYQTLQRLIQEKKAAYQTSLREIENALHRKTLSPGELPEESATIPAVKSDKSDINLPISLQTSVVVNLRAIRVGAFPNNFHDNQLFKLEALDAEARFSVVIEDGKTHTGLGMTLGQLRVALASVNSPGPPAASDITVDEIVSRATGSRGGTILNVPRVVATMETWQVPASSHIDYIFKSSFEGKVDVGWNYSRIAFIRGMWSTHSRALATRLGKPLPQAAVQITGGPKAEGEEGEYNGQEKITAVVNVPQSRYTYTPIEPAVIETPQLRDMGEATPPLEWIGLQRDRLPNITHQIIIVTLMEIAKDVEDAYSKILGSS
ncbi:Macrophage colony-stimulating factor 1 receptor [Microsporum audouinii]